MKVIFTVCLAVSIAFMALSCTTGAVPDPAKNIVTVLSSDGCANTPRAVALVDDYAKKVGLDISFERIVIQTDEDVQTHKFPKAPKSVL